MRNIVIAAGLLATSALTAMPAAAQDTTPVTLQLKWVTQGQFAGYYVANKKLPAWVIAFSSNATGESAWLLLGLTGMGYAVGIHALWIVLGEVLGVALGWVLVCPISSIYHTCIYAL